MLLGAEHLNCNVGLKTSGDLKTRVVQLSQMKDASSARLGDYEVHDAWEGFASIRQISSGEIMHSRTDPMEEARQLYVEQSNLAERLRRDSENEGLIIWDVGLGAAANAIAAMECYENAATNRPLRIVSFENDLDPLRLALRKRESFPYLRAEPAERLIAKGEWRAGDSDLSWTLMFGDFRETMNRAPSADIIFYDMFSTKTSAGAWSFEIFRRLFQTCGERPVELFTYTCSTANRAALLAAGFYVARGRSAGQKIETTIALSPAAVETPSASSRELLGEKWLEKWSRSTARFPWDISVQEQPAFEQLIRSHPQFAQ
jgi:queuine tRNA-ribosyltransferase